jgi:hypothetical protein
MAAEVECMAVSIDDASRAEPSSDFPTEDDCGPCARMPRQAKIACAILVPLTIALIGFLVGRAITRRRIGRG